MCRYVCVVIIVFIYKTIMCALNFKVIKDDISKLQPEIYFWCTKTSICNVAITDQLTSTFALINMEASVEYAKSEYQVIIIVDDESARLYPLANEMPKCLLPVANRPMLAYTLDSIRNSGALGMLFFRKLYFYGL